VTTVAPGSVDLVVEGPDKLPDKIRRHQLMSESFDNPSLDFASTNACTIGAGSLPSGSRAGDVILADWCGRPAANAANCFPGQEMLRAPAGPELRCASLGHRVAIRKGPPQTTACRCWRSFPQLQFAVEESPKCRLTTPPDQPRHPKYCLALFPERTACLTISRTEPALQHPFAYVIGGKRSR
jgi:hypothetical protein